MVKRTAQAGWRVCLETQVTVRATTKVCDTVGLRLSKSRLEWVLVCKRMKTLSLINSSGRPLYLFFSTNYIPGTFWEGKKKPKTLAYDICVHQLIPKILNIFLCNFLLCTCLFLQYGHLRLMDKGGLLMHNTFSFLFFFQKLSGCGLYSGFEQL